jgi:16S rRNA (guanine(1405)-N(7))-methyltransferase
VRQVPIDAESVAAAVLAARRYRGVAPALVRRLAREEAGRARTAAEAEKRTKRRLHQLVGAYAGTGLTDAAARRLVARLRTAWAGSVDEGFLAVCREGLARHASTRERLVVLEEFYAAIWAATGVPGSVLDLACGLNPLAAPWMGLAPRTRYVAYDIDEGPVAVAEAVLGLLGFDAHAAVRDVASDPPDDVADVALLLKSVTTLDHQEPAAAGRLLATVQARHLVVTFPTRSLAGHGKGMERTYRARFENLHEELTELGALVEQVSEVQLPGELVYVIRRAGA